MSVKEEKICRLCLNVTGTAFEAVDQITKEMLDVLLLKMDLDISEYPIICDECAETTRKCYYFKTTCRDTADLSLAHEKKEVKLELNSSCEYSEDAKAIFDDFSICRFCMNQTEGSNIVSIDALTNDLSFAQKFPLFLPEIDFNNSRTVVICAPCKGTLECYCKFVLDCLDTEEKINMYCKNRGSDRQGKIKLNNVLYFLHSNNLEQPYRHVTLQPLKQENDLIDEKDMKYFEVNDEVMKSEELLTFKEEYANVHTFDRESPLNAAVGNFSKCTQRNHSEFSRKSIRASPETEIYKCELCTFDTKYKISLKRHMLIHQEASQIKMYRCSLCTFETRQKGNLDNHMVVHMDASEIKVYKCVKCDYEAKLKYYMRRHMLRHKNAIEGNKMYKCEMCTFTTSYKANLTRHLVIHKNVSEMEMYKCEICKYQTKFKIKLKNHMLRHKDTSEVQMHKCQMCPYETKYKRNLKVHMLVHDVVSQEIFKCISCAYKTKRKSSLKKHMITHRNVKVKQEINS